MWNAGTVGSQSLNSRILGGGLASLGQDYKGTSYGNFDFGGVSTTGGLGISGAPPGGNLRGPTGIGIQCGIVDKDPLLGSFASNSIRDRTSLVSGNTVLGNHSQSGHVFNTMASPGGTIEKTLVSNSFVSGGSRTSGVSERNSMPRAGVVPDRITLNSGSYPGGAVRIDSGVFTNSATYSSGSVGSLQAPAYSTFPGGAVKADSYVFTNGAAYSTVPGGSLQAPVYSTAPGGSLQAPVGLRSTVSQKGGQLLDSAASTTRGFTVSAPPGGSLTAPCAGMTAGMMLSGTGVPGGSLSLGIPGGSLNLGIPGGSFNAGIPGGSLSLGVPGGSLNAGVPGGSLNASLGASAPAFSNYRPTSSYVSSRGAATPLPTFNQFPQPSKITLAGAMPGPAALSSMLSSTMLITMPPQVPSATSQASMPATSNQASSTGQTSERKTNRRVVIQKVVDQTSRQLPTSPPSLPREVESKASIASGRSRTSIVSSKPHLNEVSPRVTLSATIAARSAYQSPSKFSNSSMTQSPARTVASPMAQSPLRVVPRRMEPAVVPMDRSSVRPIAGLETKTSDQPTQPRAKCSILNIPDEYMSVAQISQEDLSQIQEMTGTAIQFSRPDPTIGKPSWEIRIFGSETSRRRGHEILETTINERIKPDERDEPQEFCMTIPAACMRYLGREDFEKIRGVTGCQVELSEVDANVATQGWQVFLTGAPAAIDQAHKMVGETLNQKMAEAAQAAVDNLHSQRQESEQTHMACDLSGRESIGHGRAHSKQSAASATTDDMCMAAITSSTVIPVPSEYVNLLSQEDVDELQRLCEITIEEPAAVSDDWTFTFTGSAEQREACHQKFEQVISAAMSKPSTEDQQLAPDESCELPDTVTVPISYQYLRRLYNLDAIQEVSGAQIKVSPPEPGTENDDWMMAITGTSSQRDRAQLAIEDTIKSILENEERFDGDPGT